MSDKDKYYIDGYGTKRPKDVPFWDSAKGQLVKKAGNDLLTTGSFALGLLLPFGKLKILKTLSRVLNGAAIADFVTSDRVTTVDDDIKNGEYGKAAVTGLEALLTAGAIGSGFSKLPGVQKRAAMFARDGLVKLYTELLLYLKERINLIYNINVQVRTFTKFLKLKSM